MYTMLALIVILLIVGLIGAIFESIHDKRTWGDVRRALRVTLTPGDTITARGPSYLTDNGNEAPCHLTIRQEPDGLRRYMYHLEVEGLKSFDFSHGEVNDLSDGNVVEYLKEYVYHGRWIVQ